MATRSTVKAERRPAEALSPMCRWRRHPGGLPDRDGHVDRGGIASCDQRAPCARRSPTVGRTPGASRRTALIIRTTAPVRRAETAPARVAARHTPSPSAAARRRSRRSCRPSRQCLRMMAAAASRANGLPYRPCWITGKSGRAAMNRAIEGTLGMPSTRPRLAKVPTFIERFRGAGNKWQL